MVKATAATGAALVCLGCVLVSSTASKLAFVAQPGAFSAAAGRVRIGAGGVAAAAGGATVGGQEVPPSSISSGVSAAVGRRTVQRHVCGRTGGRPGWAPHQMVATEEGMGESQQRKEGGGRKPIRVSPTAHDLATGRDPTRVKVFDTTLRDGEQSPGCTLNGQEKMAVAKQLSRLGVDVIEAGFPVASKGDFEAVASIAKVVGNGSNPPIICGLARALTNDIEVCYEAIKGAAFPRIHTFIATSDIHMEHKLRKSRDQVLDITREMVTLARSLVDDVEFSAEDALRSDLDFLSEVYSVAVEAGATTLNVPDTVGYTTPVEFYNLMTHLRSTVRGIEGVTISVHGHDDLGMAVANFMSAIEGGARQVECTINGIGERAGNAALEEIVMGLHVRKAYYNTAFGRDELSDKPLTNINTKEIFKSSRLVSTLTGMMVQANKAIVGANAFAHESGIHQDGVLKNKETYEIMDAALVGLNAEDNGLVLGKHSGRAAFRARIADLGFAEMPPDDLDRAFARFKELADKKKTLTNMDIESILFDQIREVDSETYELRSIQTLSGTTSTPTATATLYDKRLGETITMPSIGTGPVDAAFVAISKACSLTDDVTDLTLLEYSVASVTAGIDAIAEVTVRVRDGDETGRVYFGRASDNDVIQASSLAYLSAINTVLAQRGGPVKGHPQRDTLPAEAFPSSVLPAAPVGAEALTAAAPTAAAASAGA